MLDLGQPTSGYGYGYNPKNVFKTMMVHIKWNDKCIDYIKGFIVIIQRWIIILALGQIPGVWRKIGMKQN